jgi:hypothetical protein
MGKNTNIIVFLLLNISVFAQTKKDLKADSLLNLFKSSDDVFIVLNKLDLYKINYFDCYNQNEIKNYTLKWLDFEATFNHHVNNVIKRAFDESYKTSKVKGWLKNNKLRHLEDTVLKTPELFNMYLDSVYKEFTDDKRSAFFKNGGALNDKALRFFMKYPIPEAYTLIRQYWDKQDNSLKSPYFKVMLAMHDPLAITSYSTYLETIIKKKDYNQLRIEIQRAVNEYNYGSVCVDFKLKLLKEQLVVPILLFDSGDKVGIDSPYNLVFLYPYVFDYYFFKSKNLIITDIIESLYSMQTKGGFPIENMSIDELKKISKEVIANYTEFEKAANEYKSNLQKKEEYWKVNMPYNK